MWRGHEGRGMKGTPGDVSLSAFMIMPCLTAAIEVLGLILQLWVNLEKVARSSSCLMICQKQRELHIWKVDTETSSVLATRGGATLGPGGAHGLGSSCTF